MEEGETAEGCIKVRAVWTAASTVTLAGLTADFVAAEVGHGRTGLLQFGCVKLAAF
ncbi:MAG: hypothetical protein FWG03_06925 [Clostridiales bacterium]|nr:hypothetical protein [Clostridiales bacterium]